MHFIKGKIKKITQRICATFCAALCAVSILNVLPNFKSEAATVSYVWNKAINPYNNKGTLRGSLTGVSGQKVAADEQICRFNTGTDFYGLCVQPSKDFNGSTYINGYELKTSNYWSSVPKAIKEYIGLTCYYGYPNANTSNAYFAATQLIIWELVTGYRSPDAAFSSSEAIYKYFTFGQSCYTTKDATITAYNDIVKKVRAHDALPSSLKGKETASLAKENPNFIKYNFTNKRYEVSFEVGNGFLSNNLNNYAGSNTGFVAALQNFADTYGMTLKSEKGTTNTKYTLYSSKKPEGLQSSAIATQKISQSLTYANGVSQNNSLVYSNGSTQDMYVASAYADEQSGYLAFQVANYPNTKLVKTFKNANGKTICTNNTNPDTGKKYTKAEIDSLLADTKFYCYTAFGSESLFVVADQSTSTKQWNFSSLNSDKTKATRFKLSDAIIDYATGQIKIVINDLPTLPEQGKTYIFVEETVGNSLGVFTPADASSVKLPPVNEDDLSTNPGIKSVSVVNSSTKLGTADLTKIYLDENGNEYNFGSSEAANLREAKFVAFVTTADKTYFLKNVKKADPLGQGDSFKTNDGCYYLTIDAENEKYGSNNITTDISEATQLTLGNLEDGDYYGQIHLENVILNSSGSIREIGFIEISGTTNFGYGEENQGSFSIATYNELSSNSNVTYGTVGLVNGQPFAMAAKSGKSGYATIENQHYYVKIPAIGKIDGDTSALLSGAVIGLYDENKNILEVRTTDNTGTVSFNKRLKYGKTYYIHEIKAPSGYSPDGAYHEVIAKMPGVGDDYISDNTKIYNASQGNLPPSSSVFTDLGSTGGLKMKITSSGYVPSIPNQPYYLYFSLNKLSSINGHRVSGAAFTIKTNQDLTAKETANFSGFLASRAGQSFATGDVLCSFVTNNTSNCVAYGLPLGGANEDGDFEYTYTIQEYNVGAPFIIDDTEFTISANLSDFNQSASSSLHMPLVVKRSTVYNDAAMAMLTVTKKDAESDSPLKGAQFQLVAVNDLIVDGDTLQSSGDVIEFVDSTDEENPITINTLETDENGILKTKFWYCTDENGQQHIYYDEPDGVQAREGYLPLYRNVEYKLVEVKAPEGYEIDETQNNQIICVKNASSDDAKTKFLYTSKTITNTRQKGSITVYKVDENDNQIKLQGAEFSIYAAEDVTIEGVEYKSGSFITKITTNSEGKAETDKIFPVGYKYTIKETKAPNNYLSSGYTKTEEMPISDAIDYTGITETVTNKHQMGQITVYKVDADDNQIKLKGAKFGIYANDSVTINNKTFSAGSLIETITTDANGKAQTANDYPVGHRYTIREITPPTNYLSSGYNEVINMTFNSSVEYVNIEKTVENAHQTGNIRVYKVDADDNNISLQGAEFGLYAADSVTIGDKSYTTGSLITKVTTDESGIADFALDLPVGHKYTVKEIKAPSNYINSNFNKTYNMAYNADIQYVEIEDTVTNKYQTGSISVFKTDSNQVTPLEGAVFKLTCKNAVKVGGKTYSAGTTITTLTTGADGKATTANNLPVGYTYYLTEIKAPENYILKSEPKTITLSANASVEYVTKSITAVNTRQNGQINVLKVSSEEANKPLAGAVFNLTCTSDIEVDGETFAAGTTISTLTTNSEGKASTKNNLPVGYTYVLTETKAPTGYVMSNKNTTIELKEDTTVEYVTVNKTITNKPTSVEISKTDITDGKLIEGAKLEIREGNKVIDSWTSSASEAHKFTGVLEAGKTYTLVETYAPDGYVVSQSINFTVNKDGTINKVEMKDERAKGNIHIQKRTEFNTDIEGIKFIISGTSILGEKVNIEAITDANGEATIENVPIGTYIITEDSQTVPYGYFVSDEQSVKVTNNNTSDVTFDNKYQYGTITVYKTDSEDNTYFLAGAKFNIIARDDVTVNNKQYKSGDVIETITTDANGKAITTKLYPVNHTYKVTEIKAPDGYVITTASKNVVLSFNSAVEYTNADVNFNNDRQTGTITIYKVDANNREIKLEGAIFDVIADDDIVVAGKTVYTKGSVIETITTDSTGKATTSAKLYSGFSYLLKETKAPDGYIQENTEKKIFMFIDANVKYVSTSETIENKPTKIYVSKRDIYGDELKGAEMQLINESGTIIDTWTSDGTNHVVTNLKKGKYTLKEVASPTGYVIATNITFTIDEYNKVKVEGVDAVATTEDGYPLIVMVDDTTKVQFKKLDENGNPIDGAELELYDESGKLVDSWNSDTYYIEKELKAGMQYTLHEVSAPDGYVLSADVDFTVSLDGKLDTVNMIDKSTKVKFSKKSLTGDDEVVGATLQVYDADGNLIDEWVSTTEPHYVIAEYVAGAKYTLKETVVPKGYVKAKDIDFTVSEDGGIDVVTMYDDITKVEIEKKNITDGKLLEGATLVIKDKNGKVIDQWVSSSTESHKLYGVLIAGETYTLTETASPYGFVLTNSVQFKVSTDGSIDKCTMINEPQYGQVTITKKGKVFTSVKTADDKTIIPVFEDRGLNGVEYDIVAVEDIYVGQSLVVKKGSVVDHLVTDENGKATSQNLFVGKYNLIETKTASGYYLDPDNCTTPIEIVYNKTSQIADTVDEALYNDKQKISISFLKAMVKDEEFGIGMNGEEANVVFGLYANERLTAADGKTIEANDLIDTVQLKVGTFEGTFSKDVPFGEYYVKEIATDGKYILNETKYLVTISPQQQTISSINISANDGKPIINDIKRGTIKIQKKTEDMLNISDIEFILSGKAENGTEIVQKATTDENGVAEFKNIPIGIYTVSENGETVPTAYLVANAQEVTVFYSQETTAEFINEEKTGSVKVKKSTVEDKFISGIAFSLTGKTDTGRDISIISLTDENGIAEFNNIPIGTYTITEDEETVNEAYIVAEPQDITVNYNEVTEVSITNAEKTGYVKIQKTTEEKLNVEGIEFILLGTSDTGRNIMQTAVTDEDGFAQFDNVPTGVYSIIENGETVPTAYLIADEQTVEVKYEEVSTVTVENKERKGRVEVQKKTEGMTDIEGIKFFLSGTSDSGRKILIESVTNSEGIAVFENIPIGSYIISEDASTVSAGYLTAKDSEVIVETEKTTTVEIKNDKKKGKISITKVDAETGEVLKGCDFEILDKDMNLICKGTTDDKGMVEFELAYGEYYYRETKAPEGYVLDDSLIPFSIEEEGQMVEIEVTNTAIPKTGIIFKGMSVQGNLALFTINFSILMFMLIHHIKQSKKKEYK